MPITSTTKLRVGRLLKAHGLKGAIKLELYTDSPNERFAPGTVLFLDGINDRNQAESLIRAILLVEADLDASPPEPEAWYDHQLVGLKVHRDDAEIGEIVRVDHLPAQDLLAIKTDSGEVLLPFVKAFVPEVDVQAGKVTITPPGGLFEELAEPNED
ncbi:MAG: 16S rRNA processing protein RimM [Actinobacteria bacterium]|nr:16S rRNA processing protein RimM [Actinomycetota bacterium]